MNFLKSLLIRPNLKQSIMARNMRLSAILCNNTPKISSTHRVDNIEKRFLVWTGKYKRIEDVPKFVAPDVMERSRNIMRIRIANIMMALTLFGCLMMVWSGKRARDRGESVEKQNILWHQRLQEEEERAKSS